jgi:methyl-accepting chemotaxis protein
MFRTFSLARKLTLGFGLVLVLLVGVGLIAISALETAKDGFVEYREMARDANLSGRVQANMLMTRMNVKDFILTGSQNDLNEFRSYFKKTEDFVAEALREINDPNRAEIIKNIDASLKDYDRAFELVVRFNAERRELVSEILNVQGAEIENKLSQILTSAKEDGDMTAAYGASIATRSLLLARLYVVKFLESNAESAAARVQQEFSDLTQQLTVLERELKNPQRRSLLAEVVKGIDGYRQAFTGVVTVIQQRNKIIAGTLEKIGPEIAADIEKVKLDIKAVQDQLGPQLQSNNKRSETLIISLAIVAILLGIVIASLIVRGILRQMGGDPAAVVDVAVRVAHGDLDIDLPSHGEADTSLYAAIRRMLDKLKEKAGVAQQIAEGNLTASVSLASERDVLGIALQKMSANLNEVLGQVQVSGEQIAAGSCQVSDASQSLSQGATESASSLEEISASLNQLASQTTTNAENANQANSLAAEASSSAQQGSQQMQAMVEAMAEINEASQNISKIIKTIDEIAFQTNLLALNAAVEAARAGQHGKGFAVVAEEVRNLAARSAKAAEETSELIEGSVEKTANGSLIANQTAEALTGIVNGIGKVTDLVAEIAAASSEQAQGVNQISQGVSQIDAVTQQNTANAEESAAAAEELSGQATQLNEMLKGFTLSRQAASLSHAVPPQVVTAQHDSWGHMRTQGLEQEKEQKQVKPQISLDAAEFGKF